MSEVNRIVMHSNAVSIVLDDAVPSRTGSYASTVATGQCCNSESTIEEEEEKATGTPVEIKKTTARGRGKNCTSVLSPDNSYAANKNVAEGLMDIALLSANANQLRFLITYNHESSTYYYSLVLVILSLVMQLFVGIALIFKNRLKRCRSRRFARTHELLVMGVFMITVINILLAAFTTTDGRSAARAHTNP
ncbi:ninjurin-1 [Scaptodrosophila lebanonensis]|uniref:Ninjurin-1 n=1 Tax=Drosophila lebanonensis TaxID=7225 RepID=A0A6J2T5W8_DROLE|nr:ninjurin-1 [Scaptodrosophila lebanonensis]